MSRIVRFARSDTKPWAIDSLGKVTVSPAEELRALIDDELDQIAAALEEKGKYMPLRIASISPFPVASFVEAVAKLRAGDLTINRYSPNRGARIFSAP